MLFFDQFKNYEDFESRFGFKKDINGNYLLNKSHKRQRKNGVIYQFFKESFLHFRSLHYDFSTSVQNAIKFNNNEEVVSFFYRNLFHTLDCSFSLVDFSEIKVLNNGICLDDDIQSIRYKNLNNGHIYKMKIGKYLNKLLDYYDYYWAKNDVIRQFCIEELTENWKKIRMESKRFKIVIDQNFKKSYSSDYRDPDNENFNSCMDDKDNYSFYENYPKLFRTIRLEDPNGNVFARANLINVNYKGCDVVYLERIYGNKRVYCNFLFELAKKENIFTLYKHPNASCHDSLEIYDINDNCRIKNILGIYLSLRDGDYMAYQDTFKYYYPDDGYAYNDIIDDNDCFYGLDTTENTVYLDDWYENQDDE